MSVDTKEGCGLSSLKHVQTRLIWNNLVSLSKTSLMGHFSQSIFVKEYQFYVRIEKYGELWMLKITLLINM